MIIDRAPLTGLDAYLTDDAGNLNLGGPTGARATLDVTGEGRMIRVDGIDLMLSAEKLVGRMARSAGGGPVLSVSVRKEMFRGLFADPYSHRVHSIAGREDLTRGSLSGGRVAEVDGQPTLISTAAGVSWTSPIYRFDDPVSLAAAAWDIPASRRAPEEAFSYSLMLQVWTDGPSPLPPVMLADDAGPSAVRAVTELELKDVTAYRAILKARVDFDPAYSVLTARAGRDPSYGRPILRGVSLLEPLAPMHEFYSLTELLASCRDASFLDGPLGSASILTATLDISASLADGEGLAVQAGDGFDTVEARLIATRLQRPPITDEEV